MYAGAPGTTCYNARVQSQLGLLNDGRVLKIAEIRDGTSNSILFGEHEMTYSVTGSPPYDYFWWNSGYHQDVFYDANFPPNGYRKFTQWSFAKYQSASSWHPGGCNFAFADGSVHFIKETVNSWPINMSNGDPVGITKGSTCGENLMGTARPGVYQALHTPKGGEVISADQY